MFTPEANDFKGYRILSNGLITNLRTGLPVRRKTITIDGRSYTPSRLVAEAFIPNPLEYKYVIHKDGNKKNMSINNLEWCDNQNKGKKKKQKQDRTYLMVLQELKDATQLTTRLTKELESLL